MFVSPIVGFTLLVAVMAVAGLDMLLSARTAVDKAAAVAFMAILAAFIATLVVMIVI